MTRTVNLPDIQSQIDVRGVVLDRVGVTGLYYPLLIREKTGGRQSVTSCIDLTVGLHHEQRGAHLSSLVEVLHSYHERLFSMDDLRDAPFTGVSEILPRTWWMPHLGDPRRPVTLFDAHERPGARAPRRAVVKIVAKRDRLA